jgi:voltage-gated potassium channel
MEPEQVQTDEKDLGYEIFIAAVSVLSIFNLVLVLIPGVDPDAVNVVTIINLALTLIFLFDFGYRIFTAKSKSYYFIHNYGWADLLACSTLLRFLRLFRIYKAYRLIKKHGTKVITNYLSVHRADMALYLIVFCVMLILEMGAFLVLSVESKSPSANITTASDALWWAFVTITTVGYGDRFPVTNAGRLVGLLVMATGVGIFATFAGFLSNKLLAPAIKDEEEKSPEDGTVPFEKQVITGMEQIQTHMSQQERKNEEITTRLEKLENLLNAGK